MRLVSFISFPFLFVVAEKSIWWISSGILILLVHRFWGLLIGANNYKGLFNKVEMMFRHASSIIILMRASTKNTGHIECLRSHRALWIRWILRERSVVYAMLCAPTQQTRHSIKIIFDNALWRNVIGTSLKRPLQWSTPINNPQNL